MIIEDLVDVQILVELRRRLSYAEAARILKLPPATLSRRVMKMEERAGVLLFERSTRSVGITDAGQLAADHAERILEEAEAADHSIEGLRDTPVGVVRLSTPIIFGQAVFGPIISEFLKKYSECRLQLDLTDRHVDLIEESVDVVIRVGAVGDEGLLVKPLGLVFAGLYRRSRPGGQGIQPPNTIEDLAQCPLGLLHSGSGSTPYLTLVSPDGDEQKIAVEPRLICLNPWLLMDAALSSDMIVVLPNIVASKNVKAGLLERVLPNFHARLSTAD